MESTTQHISAQGGPGTAPGPLPVCAAAQTGGLRGGREDRAPRRPGSAARPSAASPACLLAARFALAVLAVACLCMLAAPHAAWAQEAAEAEEGSAVAECAAFGVSGFTRYNTGAARLVDGEDVGYRYPLPEDCTLVLVNTDEGVYVHVDETAAARAGFAPDDAGDFEALRVILEQLDEEASKGGALLADDPGTSWTVTTGDEVEVGAARVRFAVEAGGRRYCSVVPADVPAGMTPQEAAAAQGIDLGDAVRWVEGGQIVAAREIARAEAPTAPDQLAAFFANLDLRPLWVSLKTSGVALAVTFALGLLAAWRTMGTSSRLKGLLDSVFTIPMVLPPTVCGFLLLLVFGQATPVGRWLIDHGVALVFTWPAAVLSAIVVSFPLMYRTALGAFESLDPQMLDAARTLGWSEGRIFRRLMMPLAWPSVAAGTVLAFARAMGEFGCTLFFAGNYAGVTQTIPIAIYFEWMSGNTDVALFWVAVVIALSFAVILFINVYTARSQRYRARGITRGGRRQDAGAPPAAQQATDTVRLDQEALRALLAQPADGAEAAGDKGHAARQSGEKGRR